MVIKVAVIGLGYVGLPVAIAFAAKFKGSVGFDIQESKIKDLQEGIDRTGEISSSILKKTSYN